MKEYICGKCQRKFYSLRSGRDCDFIEYLKKFVQYAKEEGFTDEHCRNVMFSWLNKLEDRLYRKYKILEDIQNLIKMNM